jgi:hypothetical protein
MCGTPGCARAATASSCPPSSCCCPCARCARNPSCSRRAGAEPAGALRFHDADHGDGATPRKAALAWLETLLQAEGITDADGEIWLQCYPRVLGYSFKPVSFWYCHRTDGSLRAIVAEVNNTFGERHAYLLDHPHYGQELRRARCSMSRRFARWRAATALSSSAAVPGPALHTGAHRL